MLGVTREFYIRQVKKKYRIIVELLSIQQTRDENSRIILKFWSKRSVQTIINNYKIKVLKKL